MNVPKSIQDRAKEMRNEIEMFGGRGLVVVLTPAPDPRHSQHKIRTVAEQNPPWFRKFVAEHFTRTYGNSKRARPNGYYRPRILSALDRIAAGETRGTKNEMRLIDFIRRQLRNERDRRRRERSADPNEHIPF